jgi:hypothetical protein
VRAPVEQSALRPPPSNLANARIPCMIRGTIWLAQRWLSEHLTHRTSAVRPSENDTMVRPAVAVVVTMLCVLISPGRAMAQDAGEAPSLFVKMTAPAASDSILPGPVARAVRGSVLPSLYASLIGLQAYDGYSTNHGLKNGASESNAILALLTKHPAAVWAVKGGAAFASIYAAEHLWRTHRRGQAIAVMAVSTGIMAAVAANNAAIIRGQR